MMLPSFQLSIRYGLRCLLVLAGAYALVSIVIIVLSQQLSAAIFSVTLPGLINFFLLVALAFTLRIIRWCYLTGQLVKNVSWRTRAEIYIGGFPMTLTPGRVGEIWRAWALNQQCSGGYRRLLPLVFFDRLLDLTTLLLFVCLGIFTAVAAYRFPAIISLIMLTPLVLLGLKPRWGRKIIKLCWSGIGRPKPRRFAMGLAMCRHAETIVTPAVYFPALLLSLCAWSAEALAIFYIALQLHADLSVAGAMSALGLGNIAGVISFLPGGIGGQEATMIYLLQQYGNNTVAVAAAITIIARVGTIFGAALMGMPFFIKYSRVSTS